MNPYIYTNTGVQLLYQYKKYGKLSVKNTLLTNPVDALKLATITATPRAMGSAGVVGYHLFTGSNPLLGPKGAIKTPAPLPLVVGAATVGAYGYVMKELMTKPGLFKSGKLKNLGSNLNIGGGTTL